ncbi:MAG TPA: alpha-2-macroglobulin family protein, partial [Planctomycetota bacterium]|nr:alpha-2-macroglobulin family protein [Planctomycetota bacterium]
FAKAALVIDGTEVWTEQKTLGAAGETTFRFAVPANVDKGAARFVATITDGGVVETEVKPFVVPTGKVLVAAFPEGGDLVAGVENGLYLECSDPLGRPVDTAGELRDERGQVAKFRTAHQGRVKLTFVPREGSSYHVRLAGQEQMHALPTVQAKGIAMRLPGTDVTANAPLRLALAGRGSGPWLVGVFCRGVLVGQTTLRADERGELRAEAEVPLPADAAGVLRATVFDRNLQPVAERLVRRAAAHRIDIELASRHEAVAPGETQQVTVRTKTETGKAVAAVVGLSVTDLAAVSLGSEPRIGLADYAMLFADVERLENLGDFFPANAEAARNVDLLLGTRGWRRFVWRNDDAAKAAMAKRGVDAAAFLAREGFSQTPQVASNLQAAQATGAVLRHGAVAAGNDFGVALRVAFLVLSLHVLLELVFAGLRLLTRLPRPWPAVASTVIATVLVMGIFLMGSHPRRQLVEQLKAPAPIDLAARSPSVFEGMLDGIARWAKPDAPALGEDFEYRLGLGGAGASGGPGRRPEGGHQVFAVYAGLGGVDPSVRVIDLNGFGQGTGDISYLAWLPINFGAAGWDDRVVRRFAARYEGAQPAYFLPLQWQERQYAHQRTPHEGRTDFTSTIFWNTLVATDAKGEATVSFATSDAVTTWLVQADAHAPTGPIGRVGQAEAKFEARLPFHLEAKLPDEVSQGDLLQLPVAAIVTQDLAEVALRATAANGVQLGASVPASIALQNGRGRVLLPITVGAGTAAKLTLQGKAGRFTDLVEHTLRIAPRGFPYHRAAGGTVAAGKPQTFVVVVPADAVPGSGHVHFKVYP